jgi:predicted dehydrogenase
VVRGRTESGPGQGPGSGETGSWEAALAAVAPGVNNARMKFGLLGCDSRIGAVAEAAVRRGDQIALVAEAAAERFPDARATGWEALLDAAACDAILVGREGWSDARAEAVRLLVQAGRPLLITHPPALSMLWAWELEMIRRDTAGVIVPLLPERLHPWIAAARQRLEAALAAAGPVGRVETLVFSRRLPRRDRDTVLRRLARDADLVRVLTGDPSRLSALGPAIEAADAWQSLVVGLSGPDSVPVRWQAEPTGQPGLGLTVQGSDGAFGIEIPDDWSQPWAWQGEPSPPAVAGFDPAATILTVLDRRIAVASSQAGSADEAADIPPATWSDAARAIELAETVPRSLGRGRAVDLHHEEYSDLGTFRGTMASLGCGIILAALGLLLVAALVGGLAHEFGWDLGRRIAGTWPIVALVALGGFLALQLLPVLIGDSSRHE